MPSLPMLFAVLNIYSFLTFCLLAMLFLYASCHFRSKSNLHNLPYPPGPRPLPIIGNLFELARDNEIAAYLRLYREYGKEPSLILPV